MGAVSKALSLDNEWARYLSWGRVLLAGGALAGEFLAGGRLRGFAGALAAFLVFSLVVAIKRPARKGVFALLELFADTVFFLAFTNFGTGQSLWLPAIFYLYLLASAISFYGPREVFVVVGICVGFCAVGPRPSLWMLLCTVIVGGAVACAFAITKKRLNDRLASAITEAAGARDEVGVAREDERQRIASDFHDGPLQSFISLQMRMEIVRKLLERDLKAGMQELQQVQNLARAQVQEFRAFLRSMRPVDVDGGNFAVAARRIVENFQKESGIPVTILGGDAPFAMPQEVSAEVLQMLREALHNVHKHAGASRVAVAMEKMNKMLEISVDDNGRGFHFSGTYNLEEMELLRLGPASLKRRARSLNVDLVLESRPGQGAGLKMRIPS
jgi:signal transduction histidine kinase